MIIINHFREILYNFYYLLFSFFSTAIIIYSKKEIVLKFILNIFNINKISFFNLTEAFWTFLQLSCTFSFFCNIPFCSILLFLFSRPALYKFQEFTWKNKILLFLFINSFIYFYFIVPEGIPLIINYFKNFETNTIEYIPTFWNLYLFNIKLSFIFLICFNIPFFLPLIEKNYIKNRSKYFLILLIIIAVLTPPDIYSLIIIIIPIIVIIESSLLLKNILNY